MDESHPICSVEGCGKRHLAHGWCSAHYHRWRRHGDPCGGRVPNGEALSFLHRSLHSECSECIEWPFILDRNGYGKVYIPGKLVLAHRLMCELAHGPAPTPNHEAAHNNNGKPCVSGACINPRHLRWATRAENIADTISHGRTTRGERNENAKLSERQVLQICAMSGKRSVPDIADRFSVSTWTVQSIIDGTNWGWLTGR